MKASKFAEEAEDQQASTFTMEVTSPHNGECGYRKPTELPLPESRFMSNDQGFTVLNTTSKLILPFLSWSTKCFSLDCDNENRLVILKEDKVTSTLTLHSP